MRYCVDVLLVEGGGYLRMSGCCVVVESNGSVWLFWWFFVGECVDCAPECVGVVCMVPSFEFFLPCLSFVCMYECIYFCVECG